MKKLYAILTVLVALSLALTACGPKAQSPVPAAPMAPASTEDDWCTGADQMKVLAQHQDADQTMSGHQDRLVLTAWFKDHMATASFNWTSGKKVDLKFAEETPLDFTEVALEAKVKLDDHEMVATDSRWGGVGVDLLICYSPVP